MKKDPAFQAWRKKIIAQYKMNPLLKKRLDLFKLGGDKFFSLEGDLVNILQEYNKDNGLGLSDKDITTLSFSGQQDSKDFKRYINDRMEMNKSTYRQEKDKYDSELSKLIYRRK